MTKELFQEYVIKYLIPAVISVGGKLGVKKIVVQMDQAGGHGGGRGNMNAVLKKFNSHGSQVNPKIVFIIQPSRSPDFNALDLGNSKV